MEFRGFRKSGAFVEKEVENMAQQKQRRRPMSREEALARQERQRLRKEKEQESRELARRGPIDLPFCLLVLLLTVGMFLYLKYSKQGYEITVVGDSVNTARYAGISVKKVTIRTMAISGAICGMAGFIAVSGASHTISTSTAGGRGFTAIIVAWLAQFNTFVMILISLLLVFLQKGAIQIASQFNLNDYASNIITGIILFFILGSEFFINYRVILRGKKEGEAK